MCRVGQNHIYPWCIYGVYGREITNHTFIHGVLYYTVLANPENMLKCALSDPSFCYAGFPLPCRFFMHTCTLCFNISHLTSSIFQILPSDIQIFYVQCTRSMYTCTRASTSATSHLASCWPLSKLPATVLPQVCCVCALKKTPTANYTHFPALCIYACFSAGLLFLCVNKTTHRRF